MADRRRLITVVAGVALLVIAGAVIVATHLWSVVGASPAADTTPASLPVLAGNPADAVSPAAQPARGVYTPAASASAPARGGPLAGKVVGIDPGHNGRNGADPAYIDRMIWNGREMETCDTTGTETDSGYTEARFNFNVAMDLRADLVQQGARVVLTRTSNDGVGPCVTRRAQIINDAHANVAVDIHADGGPPAGRGFTVLEPVADGPNDKVIAASDRFGRDVHEAVQAGTPMPVSDYYGNDGYEPRDDLAGLNLTTVPKILIECGNMRNSTDAQLLVSPTFQKQLAKALATAITHFLTSP
jgi:N-acetylmuramoyl-L-alanine amidase